ncbi:DUF1684 domain-containing protein [Leifsonia poae]|uniref:DUF1684 domain-containing protein n=1 Tax=Leifsonia poae TaxID=110933 RepID=A0A9W6HDZ1_9MICO|nr:DUF1684 domain-containing protein [Leifsonia poae]GLJ78023.1 hypothetical protein GCM10017584_35970 [Leifsonia poae]
MTDTATAPTDPRDILARYRQRRAQAVTAPKGNLALVNTQWITGDPAAPGQPIWGIPGLWSPLPAGQSGLKVTATPADDIVVDGTLVDGDAIVRGKDDANPSEVVFSDTVTGFVIASEEGDYALRVWDSNSEAIQDFGSIDAFDFNPEWIVQAAFTPIEGGKTVGFEHLKDEGKTRDMVVPGEITFSKDGVDYNLAAFKAGRALQLVFSDSTNGDSTYSVGRFLFVAPNPDGTVTLDFNLAVLPPCAFSYNFNCPLPPAQNRFSVPIEAGEKNVLNKAGELLH